VIHIISSNVPAPILTDQTLVIATTQPLISETSFMIILGIVIILIIYLIVREIRLMNTSKYNVQLEQDKLKIIQMDAATKAYPFTRLSPEQTTEIREVEDENITLETNIFAREKLVEKRLDRLENYVKVRKLDNMIGKIDTEEKKVK
jgi:flagellar biosynthesis/type III secretory pathway M-ring protein FliF/YscJ